MPCEKQWEMRLYKEPRMLDIYDGGRTDTTKGGGLRIPNDK
jgi:hypothetical protein